MLSRRYEPRTGVEIAWLIVSAVCLATILAPFVLSGETIGRLLPACEWKRRYGVECVLCGMTTSFLRLSHGHVSDAFRANRGGPFLYALFAIDSLAAIAFAMVRGVRRRVAMREPALR